MKNHGLGILAGALWAALILVPLTAGAAGTEATAQPAQPPTVAQVEQYLQGVNGAAPGSMFQHVSVMKAGASTEWLEPVDQQVFAALEK